MIAIRSNSGDISAFMVRFQYNNGYKHQFFIAKAILNRAPLKPT